MEKELLQKLDYQKLLEAIELVDSIKKIEWFGGPTGEKTSEGKDIYYWPHPMYPDGLYESFLLLGSDYDYFKNMKKIGEKDINTMSLTEMRTLLTYISRRERFYDGLIARFVLDGNMKKALLKIKDIYDSKAHEL